MRNKKVLITGATKGLGLECVKYFLKKYEIIAIEGMKISKSFTKKLRL